jgi:hypothetical protein
MEETQQVPIKQRKLNRHGKTIHEFLVRLDEDLYERVRARSYDQHVPMAQVVRDALLRYL